MYSYDVVASIYNENRRTDSHLICGGFTTEEDAIDYINKHGISEADYYGKCKKDEQAVIEIEIRNTTDGSIVYVVSLD